MSVGFVNCEARWVVALRRPSRHFGWKYPVLLDLARAAPRAGSQADRDGGTRPGWPGVHRAAGPVRSGTGRAHPAAEADPEFDVATLKGGEKYTGWIVFDLPSKHGDFVYGGPGWGDSALAEWTF